MSTEAHGERGSRTRQALSRRRFLADSAKLACGVGLLGLGLGLYAHKAGSMPALAIRPPGALPEDDFLAACTRCGLCVRDCPYDVLKLGDVGDDVPIGTPYFVAREKACVMCLDLPCVPACPTGALDHALTDINESRMGLAVLVDQETCIAFLGLRCEVCYNICPIRGDAISLDRQHNARSSKHALFIPVVQSDACTGCGLCEQACILEESAIRVLPQHLAKGELGSHYRLGWREKERAGKALVTPDKQHRYNLPEGVRYEHGGEGLIRDDERAPTPFSANPLDTLNRGQGER